MAITIPDIAKEETLEYYHPLRMALLHLKNSAIGLSFEDLQQFKITRIECFRYDRELSERQQLGHGTDHFCGLLAVSSDTGAVGFREFAIPCHSIKNDFTMWAALFHRIKGLTLMESMNYVQLKEADWGSLRTELVKSALMDLIGKSYVALISNKDQRYFWNRAYLFDHTQAYISF